VVVLCCAVLCCEIDVVNDMSVNLYLSASPCRYKCVIVLCDSQWADPDLDSSNGIQMNSLRDMLRIDSMLMMVQLNIRVLLEVSTAPYLVLIKQDKTLPLQPPCNNANFESHLWW